LQPVSIKYTFQTTSEEAQRPFPHKILLVQQETETVRHVVLKLLAWALFFRERIQIETDVQNDSIPFVPDLVQLGYDMRPLLWVECGECSLQKLHKLAVKCPEAELWVVRRSAQEAESVLRGMEKEKLRRNRYGVIGFDADMFDEMCGLVRERNTFHWFRGGFDPPVLQFDFNGMWFDAEFGIWRH
jgi:uncharacterized protein YaeQ